MQDASAPVSRKVSRTEDSRKTSFSTTDDHAAEQARKIKSLFFSIYLWYYCCTLVTVTQINSALRSSSGTPYIFNFKLTYYAFFCIYCYICNFKALHKITPAMVLPAVVAIGVTMACATHPQDLWRFMIKH
uniref:TPT domain-containing protein n=1 Tax=Heterorhabditis bacteriophora TaxID=37862 RepID=A0A1I7WUB0_HETBA